MREGIQFVGEREGFFGPNRLSEALRGKVREVILTLAEAELSEVLAALLGLPCQSHRAVPL
jgi:hypothetical protein